MPQSPRAFKIGGIASGNRCAWRNSGRVLVERCQSGSQDTLVEEGTPFVGERPLIGTQEIQVLYGPRGGTAVCPEPLPRAPAPKPERLGDSLSPTSGHSHSISRV